MKTVHPHFTRPARAGPWLLAATLAALAGCAPYPVYNPTSTQSAPSQPVYSQPSSYPGAPIDRRDYRRRDNEPLYQAQVTSARAVVGNAGQRCWMEREQVSQAPQTNVPGAVVGAVIGGILGHQIGGGSGRDIATVGGVVLGGVVGSRVGRDASGNEVQMQDVQRCSNVSDSGQPNYWDVTYHFQGVSHRVQMTYQPGATITVNANGEPRG